MLISTTTKNIHKGLCIQNCSHLWMEDCSTVHNKLVDSHNALAEKFKAMKKIRLDCEETLRNNIKLSRIPKKLHTGRYSILFSSPLQIPYPVLTDWKFITDRVHSETKNIPDNIMRDVLLLLHFLQIKENTPRNYHIPQPFILSFSCLTFQSPLSYMGLIIGNLLVNELHTRYIFYHHGLINAVNGLFPDSM